MRVDQNTPYYWLYNATLNGVAVGTGDLRYCFEADDEAGYVKCHAGLDDETEIVHYGEVVIKAPSHEDIAKEVAAESGRFLS